MEKNFVKLDLMNEWVCRKVDGGIHCICSDNGGTEGFYDYGFVKKHRYALDAVGWNGIYLKIGTQGQHTTLTVTVEFAEEASLSTLVNIVGAGIQNIMIPFSQFPIEACKEQRWQFITGVLIQAEGEIIKAEIKRRDKIYADARIRGKSGKINELITYQVTILNCTDESQYINGLQLYNGWESMKAIVVPQEFILEPSGSQEVEISVRVNERMVPGGHENTQIVWNANGDGRSCEILEFKTLCTLAHPYIYHNKIGWQEVKDKINKYEEYLPGYHTYQKTAEEWVVRPPFSDKPYCYNTSEETHIMSAAYMYAITKDIKYAKKVASFLCYFSDPDTGYPKKLRGCSDSYVQEGHFFQHLAIPYDIIYESGVLTEDEHDKIQEAFRLYMEILDIHLRSGHISNWLLSEMVGALYCALVIQDIHMALRFVFGNGGVIEQFKNGVFNDGWWHECSVGYNTWVSSLCLHTAHALVPFGYNLAHTHFRIPYSDEVNSTWGLASVPIRYGMYNKKWGGNRKNYVCFQDMFDAILPFLDYRGVIFGICDSDEKQLSGVHFGSTYDLAYRYYGNPEYIPVIQRCKFKDPVFGIPNLPDSQTDSIKKNAYSDSVGIAMLRSQKEGREQREQIQAVVRYGSHGYAHGHFDITNLLSVMRYGRSFYNPECCWWGYRHFMYKFYVQNSLTKNMVVVDGKMQEPADSSRILFYTGKHVQAAGVETVTRWSWPPYGGMVYEDDKCYRLEERCKYNGCYLPIVQGEGAPAYGEMTAFTEPVVQKRILVVMADYIVVFDYLEGEKTHRYDSLMQVKGFLGIAGKSVEYLKHTGQYTENPISDGQFITDCNWFNVHGESVARFKHIFTEIDAGETIRGERSNYNDPGILNIDIHTAWPPVSTQMIGNVAVYPGWPAACDGYNIPCRFSVEADGKLLAGGEFGAWLLGMGICDVEVEQINILRLISRHNPMFNDYGNVVRTPQALFWGEVWAELSDGSRINICELPLKYYNIDQGYGIGKDYMGGRVTIVGKEYPNAIPASPVAHQEEGIIEVDLSTFNIVRLYACLGADVFPGDEGQLRKTFAVQTNGKIGRFTTIIEPYEKDSMIDQVSGINENHVAVRLSDGRRHEIILSNFEKGSPSIRVSETNINEVKNWDETAQ